MSEQIRKILNENITKTDVKNEIKASMDTNEFKNKIERIVKDKLKDNKEIEDKVVEITKNVLTQLYKTLWTKRGFWTSMLKNKST
jgi:hypothetical protein